MVTLKDLLPMDFLSNNLKIYVGNNLVHDDSKSKRYITFSSYIDYVVEDIVTYNNDVEIYLD